MSKLRVAFIGQNGAVTLEHLRAVSQSFEIAAIVESAPRGLVPGRYGEGNEPARRRRTKLWRVSRQHHIPFFFLSRGRQAELAAFLLERRVDVACVASMAGLLEPCVLAAPVRGVIGFHPSDLPKYRGPNPWFWQYFTMEVESAVSIYLLDSGEDTGDILCKETFPMPMGITFSQLERRAIAVGARLMVRALEMIEDGTTQPVSQREFPCPLRARAVARDEQLIDWHEWPLHRTWHVLQGTRRWLDALPAPEDVSVGASWRIGHPSFRPTDLQPGAIGVDSQGMYFVSHREGRIWLYPEGQTATW